MKASFRTHIALAATGMGIVLSAPAFAQEAAEEGAGSAGDIIVTAQRFEQRLQDVPISMTVFNQSQLDNRNVVTPSDLATYTPSLSVNQRYGPEKSSFAIRGFNQDQSTAPTVGVYFADVVGPRAQGGTTSGNTVGVGAFMDLQNVQVLKGPQGTLFGRNTTGGAVLLVPNRPTGDLEGYVEGSIGNYDLRRVQGVINLPLADTFKVRIGAERNKRDGYMRNLSGIGPDSYNDQNYFAARLSILAELTPNLENYTIASYSNSFGRGYAGPIVACDRTLDPTSTQYLGNLPATDVRSPFNARNLSKLRLAGPACAQLDRQAARGDGLLDVEVNNPDPYLKLKQWQVINTTTWTASDSLTIKNIASYAEFRERASFSLYSDNFFVRPIPAVPAGGAAAILPGDPRVGTRVSYILLNPGGASDNAAQSTFTEELQLQGNLADGKFIWQAGAYIEISRPLGWTEGYTAQFVNCVDLQAFNCSGPYGNGNFSHSKTKLNFDNKGFYAQATYNFTEQLALTGGIRYTIDKIVGTNQSTRITFGVNGGVTGRTCNDSFRFNLPPLTPGGNPRALPVTDGSQCNNVITSKSEKPTWLLGLDYKPTPDILIYGKYARGYRQGGLNLTNVGRETWEPEKVDSFELGAKASFRGAVNGYFNIAGFYNDFSNQQIFAGATAIPTSGIAGGAVILNAGKSRIQGIEVDGSATFFDSLRFDVGYTYLDTVVKEIVTPAATFPFLLYTPTVVAGGPLTLSPKHRVTLTGTYTLPLDESLGELSVAATYTWTAKQVANGSIVAPSDPNGPLDAARMGFLPSVGLLNLNLNWKSVAGSPVDLALFATNVTNKLHVVNVGGGYNSAGFENALIGQPRMYGLRLKFNFGN